MNLLPSSTLIDEAQMEAFRFQESILKSCIDILRASASPFWIFVHLRSIAIKDAGRNSMYGRTDQLLPQDIEDIDFSLKVQYMLEREFRTYNELLISSSENTGGLKKLAFCFNSDDSLPEFHSQKINFSQEVIEDVTEGKTFVRIADIVEDVISIRNTDRKELAQSRLSLGLNKEIRKFFRLEDSEQNLLKASPEEVSYSLQILMLWSNSYKWKYIYTFHSKTKFDALSGLVLTVASPSAILSEELVKKLQDTLFHSEAKVEEIARNKQKAINQHYRHVFRITSDAIRKVFSRTYDNLDNFLEKLSIVTCPTKFGDQLDGIDVVLNLQILLSCFSSTFEGRSESYSFILGHPGFIARPFEIEMYPKIKFSERPQYRELCEGGLDRLNIVDVLDCPLDDKDDCYITPVAYPSWARYGKDSEQEFGFSLSNLSAVHREMIVVGIVCRNIAMIFKSGNLIAVFDGVWREIMTWEKIIAKLGIPDSFVNHPWLDYIYNMLVCIAYGPSPRSIILGYVTGEKSVKAIYDCCEPIISDSKEWCITDIEELKDVLFMATKTDGAILVNTKTENELFVTYKQRVTLSRESLKEVTGTGDATAQSMANQIDGMISFKVSRDGGIKVRWKDSMCKAHVLMQGG